MRRAYFTSIPLGLLTLLALLLSSCASKRIQYTKEARIQFEAQADQLPTKKPTYTLYAIGDAGYKPDGQVSPSIQALTPMMKATEGDAGIVFLGDNLYPSGMPKKDDPTRPQSEAFLDAQIDMVRDFRGDIVFLPGNHDWRQEDGQKGVRRQEKYIQSALDKKVFHPNKGCSGPKVIKLNQDVAMIVIDSEWYLQNWDDYVDFNEHCEYKTRESFIYELRDQIKKYAKDKRVIIAMHHPLYTYGVHGGRFGVMDHLFPLTNLKPPLHIPLPGLGTAYTTLRRSAGVREDINGKRYKELRDAIFLATDPFDNIIFLSGHDHNLQYIYKDEHHHVISGSGSKVNTVDLGQGSSFAAGRKGFAKLTFFDGGETWIQYYEATNGTAELIYTKQLTEQLPMTQPVKTDYNPPKSSTVSAMIVDHTLQTKGLGKALIGQKYAELYDMPYKAKATNLAVKNGGLTPVKRGGGMQTLSLRLQDKNEKDFVLRAVRKDGSKLIADDFQGTFVVDLLDYFLLTAHPMGAYTIPPMAKSIDILHTEPELVYVPKQPALGEFNRDHGDKLYLFEARPAGDRSDQESFGHSKNIVSTDDLLDAMYGSYKHRPDQHDVVRNRLFDALIGDWDRHDDQWRWAAFEGEDGHVSYRPVPRDRDQAYARFDGVLIAIGRRFSPGIGKFQSFDDEVKNVPHFNYNGRYFDRSFMNELSWEDWHAQVKHIQQMLTDDVIAEGVNRMPDNAFELTGDEIIHHLKSRRDHLESYAKEYYGFLAKTVSVPGTDQDDYILVTHQGDHTRVQFYDLGKDEQPRGEAYYDRTFHKKETKEVRLYGLDGDDRFVVVGASGKIKVRMIGGTDGDHYSNQSDKRALVYDTPEKTHIDDGHKLGKRLSHDYQQNAYDRKDFLYNHTLILPQFASNPDNGFMLGAAFTGTWHAFKKDPYASQHQIRALYSFATEGFRVDYNGHFTKVLGKLNLGIQGLYQDEFFTTNFFGIGNETVNPQEEPLELDRDYNRVRMGIQEVKVLLDKPLGDNGKFFFGPQYRGYEVNDTEDRFFEEVGPSFLNANYEHVSYLGAEVGMKYRYVDHASLPTQGLDFGIQVDLLTDVNADEDYDAITSSAYLSLYYPLDNAQRFVLGHRVGGGITFADNDDTPFYLRQQLGGNNSGLRGFNNERFTGDEMFYVNNDLRIHLFDVKSHFLPGSVGIFGGFDLGRVWVDGEDSEQWHNNYGGGLYMHAFNMALIRAGYFTSGDEQGRLTLGIGFDF